MKRYCKICGKELKPKQGRFCGRRCSAIWRNAVYGPNKPGEEARKRLSNSLKERWNNSDFRNNNHIRMTTNNPVYKEGVVDKANKTKLLNNNLPNNFKYGNGKMSKYESIAWKILKDFKFEYNKAITTSSIRLQYPEKHIGNNYKPDFVNFNLKVCIEIDGNNHNKQSQKLLDKKKDWCLAQLGYKVIRLTHTEIENGKLQELVKEWQN